MSPFRTSTNIQIRLTRSEDESEDDRIAIRYKDEDMYQLFFRDGNTKGKPQTYCTVLSGEELDVYIESLFTLLARDRDPFRSVEFQIPCFPCVQYNVEDFRQGKLRTALKDLMPVLYAAAKY
jgi:hypothetical protein